MYLPFVLERLRIPHFVTLSVWVFRFAALEGLFRYFEASFGVEVRWLTVIWQLTISLSFGSCSSFIVESCWFFILCHHHNWQILWLCSSWTPHQSIRYPSEFDAIDQDIWTSARWFVFPLIPAYLYIMLSVNLFFVGKKLKFVCFCWFMPLASLHCSLNPIQIWPLSLLTLCYPSSHHQVAVLPYPFIFLTLVYLFHAFIWGARSRCLCVSVLPLNLKSCWFFSQARLLTPGFSLITTFLFGY